MARTPVAVSLTAACMILIIVVFLLQTLGLPIRSLSALLSHDFVSEVCQAQGTNVNHPANRYLIGVGKADITGPVVEIGFMGYADPNQVGSGLRQRLYSRAFIIGSPTKPEDRIVYVVQDVQSGDTAVRQGILDGLKEMGGEYSVYGQQNVAITGTHSHSGPGAWLNYLLPQITTRGFDQQSYESIVRGTLRSIQLAHQSLQLGRLTYGKIEVPDTNINRSPYAYRANPSHERDLYNASVDKEMTMLRFTSSHSGTDIGVLTWFAVHGTSMLGNNTLVTGDNKGLAADLFEKYARRQNSTDPSFVAGFSQSNVGDTSPNVLGAWCESGPQGGQQCDFKTSLCGGEAQPCCGRGPHWGLNDAGTSSNYEIGRRQYVAARVLFESMQRDRKEIVQVASGQFPVVKSVHVFVDFANRTFTLPNGTDVRTCAAALGYSFAAGTTDGPGAFDFKQHNPGDPQASPLWEAVRNKLHQPGSDQIQCQGVKPILLDVGETTKPYLWTPNVVDLQFFRIGNLFIIVSPGEATTMASRRWKNILERAAVSLIREDGEGVNPLAVLGGPANSYTHYITTTEEYAVQRYEGASTLYGPHTLAAYLDLTSRLIPYLTRRAVAQAGASVPPLVPTLDRLDPGPSPPVHTNISLSFIGRVIRDSPGIFRRFGDVLVDTKPSYSLAIGQAPSIEVIFVAANPRNNAKLDNSFVTVERYDEQTGIWRRFRDDSDWSTVFEWERTSTLLGTSRAKVRWELGWELDTWGSPSKHDSRGHRDLDFPMKEHVGKNIDPWQPWRQSQSNDYHASRRSAMSAARRPSSPQKIRRNKISGFADDYLAASDLRARYRIRYRGDAKNLNGDIQAFEGLSREFNVT
ncbi:hypothetical protein CAC42_1903 [Sphaceloma murrayae]|uniref:Neutral ceramidase n=1 Tax=Sphaceloma murrayae TaxID=2082308 RepID=A0A2K1QVS9_9PEZI|nr:hypothetical protein CAC42_1903 [Sphaceloma murrayae]